MMLTSIILGILVFTVLCLIGVLIYHKWNKFKNLRPGDTCGKFIDYEMTSELIMSEIIRVDVDDNGYTTKVYTKDNEYTFLQFIRDNIIPVYD